MQLGIEAIMRRHAVKERIAEVPVFQQYVYDTLYWPSYQHEQGLNEGTDQEGKLRRFVLKLDSLKEYLWFRAKGHAGCATKISRPTTSRPCFSVPR